MVKFSLNGALEFNQAANASDAFIANTVGPVIVHGEYLSPFTEVLRENCFNCLSHVVTTGLWSILP
jgi:hypothetical protein